jgi:hypothetical protein
VPILVVQSWNIVVVIFIKKQYVTVIVYKIKTGKLYKKRAKIFFSFKCGRGKT